MILSGKVALVAGGVTGVAAVAAAAFRKEGAAVVVTAEDSLAVQSARKAMPELEVMELDSLDTVAMSRLVETIADRHRKIDVLFLSPGAPHHVPIDLVDEAFFDREFDVNVRGLYFTLKSSLSVMSSGASIIIAWASPIAGGVGGASVDGATRAALQSLGRHLATELAPRNIRVNWISPAFRARSARDDEQAIAAAALFLASDASAVVTGAELLVGGALL